MGKDQSSPDRAFAPPLALPESFSVFSGSIVDFQVIWNSTSTADLELNLHGVG